jgi:RING finger protein 113A
MEKDGDELLFKKASSSRRRGRKKDDEELNDDEGGDVLSQARQKKRGVKSTEVRATADDGLSPVVFSGPATTKDLITVAASEKVEDVASTGGLQAVVSGEKVYAGEKARASFFKISEGAMKGTAGMKAGPIKASSFIKSATLIDYNPSVCKDYKQTGFCGYGANCIYVHDRGDYKSGWEIDKEWASKKKGNDAEENYEINSSDDDDNLPFACLICRQDFVDPVVTRCGHYFCESCALTQEKKTKRCAVCNEPTAGIFNQPKALLEKLAKKGK